MPLPQGEPRRLRRFVLLLAAAAVLLVLVAAGFNAVIDPYGTVGTGLLPTVTWSDRSLKAELVAQAADPAAGRDPRFLPRHEVRALLHRDEDRADGVQRRRLERPPDRRVGLRQPHPRHLSGRRSRATSGCWTWRRSGHGRRIPACINTPQLARYLPAGAAQRHTPQGSQAALLARHRRGVRHAPCARKLRGGAGATTAEGADFAPDGFRIRDYHDARAQAGVPLAGELRKTIRQAEATYRDDYRRLDPRPSATSRRRSGS